MAGYIAGNGLSRKGIDLQKVKERGTLYGCNALHLDINPHVLVATDDPISHAIQNSGYALHNKFYTRAPFSDKGALELRLPYANWSSGSNAIQLAIQDGHSEIYLFGFDFGSADNKFNNCYADHEFYKKSTSDAIFTGNWFNQILTLFQHNKNIEFYIVKGIESQYIASLNQLLNVNIMNLADFAIHINTVKDDNI